MSVIEVLINAEQAAKGKFKINEGDYLEQGFLNKAERQALRLTNAEQG